MPEGFDFDIDTSGELIMTADHNINTVTDDDLRIQLAFDRIKSISKNWFIDEIGADLEEIIGRPCDQEHAEIGKKKILNVLIIDELWDLNDIVIAAEIKNNINITFTVYLKTVQNISEETITTEIICELDLIKGVNVRYGWEPRR